MDHGELTALYVLGENPAQSEADSTLTHERLRKLEFMVVQDIFRTGTAEMADVVLPASASWCEAEGTVTSSERRVQRVRKAVSPPGNARDDIAILAELSRRLGRDLGDPTPEQLWDELRALSPMHGGMSYARLEEHGGLHWPCPDEDHPGSQFLHGRLWEDPVGRAARRRSCRSSRRGRSTRSTPTSRCASPPGGGSTRSTPACRPGGYDSPMRRGETLDLCPARHASGWPWPRASACG